MNAIKETNFRFDGQKDFYRGKVRDVYYFKDHMVIVASDRISAFDVILPQPIPFKGQVLNTIAARQLHATQRIVSNWLLATPDPNASIGIRCQPYKVEMVIRGYLAGHAWREYKAGKREICGVPVPDGLKENDKLPEPIITPTTKAAEGHDKDISREEIIRNGIVSEEEYIQLEKFTRALFEHGTQHAQTRGLILVDTKYEFGTYNDTIYLIDEVHTPDSSRYFYSEGYEERQRKGIAQKQMSKEFVRQWLISKGFQGKEGQQVPEMTDEVVKEISDRYIELYEQFTGEKIKDQNSGNILSRIEKNIVTSLEKLNIS